MSIPAGWYPDPEREGASRWWDGSAWAPPAADSTLPTSTQQYAQDSSTITDSTWRFDGTSDTTASTTVDFPQPSWALDASTPQDTGAQTLQFSSPEFQSQQQFFEPKASTKNRTGLIIALVGSGVAVLIAAIVVGALVLPNLLAGVTTASSSSEPGPQSGFPLSVNIDIPQDGQSQNVITITETNLYSITATTTNGVDGKLTLTGNGVDLADDDSGGGLNPLIMATLEPGDYTVTVTEYSGRPYTGTLTVDVAGETQPQVTAFPASLDVSIARDASAVVPFTVTEGGTYTISVVATNDRDPRIDLIMPDGEIESDDDSGGGLNSLLTLSLEPGSYSLVVSEFMGNPLSVTVSISRA